MNRLLIICDGMADQPLAQLDGKTPFEAAYTPNMDALAAAGTTGLLCNCPPDYPAGSDTAILSLFGYDLKSVYTGRAPLEAADAAIALQPDAWVLRVSFLRVEDGVLQGVVSENPLEKLLASPLFSAVPGVKLYPQNNGQPLAVMEGSPGELIQPHDHVGKAIAAILPTHPCLRQLVHSSMQILQKEQLCIWFWGAGRACKLPPLPVEATLISATPLCRGIGKLAGMEVRTVPGATGDLHTDYAGKAQAAVNAFVQGRDFVAVHIEAPDECSHRLDIPGKVESIRRIDALLLPPLLEYLHGCGEAYRVLILSDHPTSCLTGRHSHEPVPYIAFDSRGVPISGNSPMELLFSE